MFNRLHLLSFVLLLTSCSLPFLSGLPSFEADPGKPLGISGDIAFHYTFTTPVAEVQYVVAQFGDELYVKKGYGAETFRCSFTDVADTCEGEENPENVKTVVSTAAKRFFLQEHSFDTFVKEVSDVPGQSIENDPSLLALELMPVMPKPSTCRSYVAEDATLELLCTVGPIATHYTQLINTNDSFIESTQELHSLALIPEDWDATQF